MLCDDLGLDTISTGGTIAWAMECYEKGILTPADTEGIDLRFGNGEALITVIEKIAKREGIGDLLAEGSGLASKKVGKGSEAFAVHVKGMELPAYHAGVSYGMALAYAVNPRGGCHLFGWVIGPEFGMYPILWYDMFPERKGIKLDPQSPEYKAEILLSDQILFRFRFSAIICDFHLWPAMEVAKAVAYCTGFDEYLKREEVIKLGLRIVNLLRLFNVREGITRKDDLNLPKRLFEPIKEGPSKGYALKREALEKMLDDYYRLFKWTKDGIPTKESLAEAGIDDLKPPAVK